MTRSASRQQGSTNLATPPLRQGKPKSSIAAPRSRAEWLALGLILVLGAGLRAGYLGGIFSEGTYKFPNVDARYNEYCAKGMATGNWSLTGDESMYLPPRIEQNAYFRPPGYAYFLAAVYTFSGMDPAAPLVLQSLLGLVNALLVYVLARRLMGPLPALIACGLASTYWVLIYFDAELHEATLQITLLLVFLILAVRLIDRFRFWPAVTTGVMLGLCALVRPNILAVGPSLLAWAWWVARRADDGRKLHIVAIGGLIGVLIAVLPVTIRNYTVSGDFVAISANGGVNLYIGNNEQASGFYRSILPELNSLDTCFDYPRIVRELQTRLGKPMSYGAASSYYSNLAFAYMKAHPLQTVKVMARKAYLLLGPHEIASSRVLYYDRLHSMLRWVPGNFPFLLTTALAGAFLLVRDLRAGRQRRTASASGRIALADKPAVALDKEGLRHGPVLEQGAAEGLALVGMVIVVYLLTFLPFFVTAMFRVAVIPLLMLPGAYALAKLAGWVTSRRWEPAALAVGIMGATYAMAAVPWIPYEQNEAKWHQDRAGILEKQGRTKEAMAEYRQAVACRPQAAPPRVALAVFLWNLGQEPQAVQELIQAIRCNPAFSKASSVLLRMADDLVNEGHADLGITAYQALVDAHPSDPLPYVRLCRAIGRAGRTDEALKMARQGRQRWPDHPLMLRGLVECLLACGKIQEAQEQAQPLLSRSPDDPAAIYIAFRLAIAQGRRDDAAALLARARAGRHPDLAEMQALLGGPLGSPAW